MGGPRRGEPSADRQPLGDAVEAERADHGVGAPRGERGMGIVHVVPGLVAQVLVMPAGVLVWDQAIHGGGDPGADREPRDDQHEAPQVKDFPLVHTAERLGAEAERRRCQHEAGPQAQDPVVGPPGKIAQK